MIFKHGFWAIAGIGALTVLFGLQTRRSQPDRERLPFFVPADDMFNRGSWDDSPFDNLLKGADLVMLGEAQHGDGATFERKCEWIRMLHRKYGFDVLLFESGLWSGLDLNAYLKTGHFDPDSVDRFVWHFWAAAEETAGLWKDLAGQGIEVGGFDLQFTESAEAVSRRLKEIAKRIGAKDSSLTETLKWMEKLHVFEVNGYFKPPAQETTLKIRAEIATLIAQSERTGGAGESLDRLLLQNFVCNLHHRSLPTAQTNPFRDSIMAKNIVELREKIYPGKKIIVWAANAHILHRAGQSKILPFKTMGDYLEETLGERCVAVLFSSFKGKTRNVYSGEEINIYEAGKSALEYRLFNEYGREGLVDLSTIPDSLTFKMRVLGHGNRAAQWAKTAEILHFIPEMTPYHPL